MVYAKMTYIHILKYAIALTMPLNKLHIMFLDCTFEISNILQHGMWKHAYSYT